VRVEAPVSLLLLAAALTAEVEPVVLGARVDDVDERRVVLAIEGVVVMVVVSAPVSVSCEVDEFGVIDESTAVEVGAEVLELPVLAEEAEEAEEPDEAEEPVPAPAPPLLLWPTMPPTPQGMAAPSGWVLSGAGTVLPSALAMVNRVV